MAPTVRDRMRRFLIIFPICLAVGFALLLAPFTQGAVKAFTNGVVLVSAVIVRLFGGQAKAVKDILLNPATGFSIQVEDTCNASNVTILLWAAILAFPASWRQKITGLIVGSVLLHAVNLLRIISLFYIGQHQPGWFQFTHLYVWESVIMLVTLAIFWTWVQRTYAPADKATN